ncbi:MAG: hypothetical protein IKL18_09715 [Oscillospiraceae bacterium]|nr:hypothetical protein [Oscillospiraceae bacterium]MBR6658425.1 hypothetical protein [Oscillospiraceae bacterium]
MKKLFLIILSLVMVLSFCSCGGRKTPSGVRIPEDDGIVDNIVIDGEEVSAVDFVTESVNKYIAGEQYKKINGFFVENFGEAIPLTVTRVIDLKAYGLSQCQMNVHYLLIKSECNWAAEENGDIFISDNLLLVADYDTGEVWSEFDKDETWLEDGEKKEYWTYMMLNGPLVGSAYSGGAIISDNVETRAEFTPEDLAAVNAGLIQ